MLPWDCDATAAQAEERVILTLTLLRRDTAGRVYHILHKKTQKGVAWKSGIRRSTGRVEAVNVAEVPVLI